VNASKGFMTTELLRNAKLVTIHVMSAMEPDPLSALNVQETGSSRMVKDRIVFAQ
jgi:hypothetical protein